MCSSDLMLGVQRPAGRALRAFHRASLVAHAGDRGGAGAGDVDVGRLAACFIKSVATLEMVASGYWIRHEFSSVEQAIRKGWPVETCDPC